MKKIIKYSYLFLGIIYYAWINYISYNFEPYASRQSLPLKIVFSAIALIALLFIYLLLLKPELIFKKKKLTKDIIISLYVGVLIVPLISLYY